MKENLIKARSINKGKLLLLGIATALMMSPLFASACPKGTHPVGGTTAHHKGGHCVLRE